MLLTATQLEFEYLFHQTPICLTATRGEHFETALRWLALFHLALSTLATASDR